jgi:hypothetical protein
MASYKVLSENFSAGEQGAVLDSASLDGCNIEALVEAGHLAEVSAKVSKSVTSEQEK